jgi:Tfp pilus assembly protein PilV
MKRRRRLINERGISLITALVALVLLAVGILGAAEAFLYSIKNNGSAGGVTTLTNLAMETAEKVMLLPDDAADDATGIMSADGSSRNALTVLNFPDAASLSRLYDVQLTVSPASNIDENLIKIEIVARYTAQYAGTMGTTPAASEVLFITYRYREQ